MNTDLQLREIFNPALVKELAELTVIHGGQGTVQTACWAGTPAVGVAFQFEQQANLDILMLAALNRLETLSLFN